MINLNITLSPRLGLLCCGVSPEQVRFIDPLLQKYSMECIEIRSEDQLLRSIEKRTNLAGIVVIDNPKILELLKTNGRIPLALPRGIPNGEFSSRLDAYISQPLPSSIVSLIENILRKVPGPIYGVELKDWTRSLVAGTAFTHWALCDSVADGIISKAICKFNLEEAKSSYPAFKDKSENLLLDASAEVCNQILGAFNSALRQVSLTPLISLPVKLQANKQFCVNQINDVLCVQFLDGTKGISAGIFVQIDPSCSTDWGKVPGDYASDTVEFL